MFLRDVQESLQGSGVINIPNGHKLCSELLNCSTVLQRPKRPSRSAGGVLNQPSQNSTVNDVVTAGRKKLRRKRLSKVELSGFSRPLCLSLADTSREMSGYDADIEREAIVGKIDKDTLPPQDSYLGKITFFSPVFHALNLIFYEASPQLTASWYECFVECRMQIYMYLCNLSVIVVFHVVLVILNYS